MTYMPIFPVLQDSDVGDSVVFADTPGGSPILGGRSWAIPANVDDARAAAAWEFTSWIESPEIRKERALNGASPTCTDVLSSEEVIQSNPAFYENTSTVFENAKPLPSVPGGTEAYQQLGTELSQAVAGNKEPEQAITDAISAVESALD